MHRVPLVLSLALSIPTLVSPAIAGESNSAELAMAVRLFDEAQKLEAQQRWGDAALKLEEAVAINDTPGLHFHLAVCRENMGELVEASIEYHRARQLIGAGQSAPDVLRLLEPAEAELVRKLPTLRVHRPNAPLDMTISIDGRKFAISLLDSPVPLNPGPHSVVVSAPGHEAFRVQFDLGEGARPVTSVELKPEEGNVPAPVPVEADRAVVSTESVSTRSLVLWGGVGATVVSAGFGTWFTISAASADDDISAAQNVLQVAGADCVGNNASEPTCQWLAESVDDSESRGNLAIISWAATGAFALGTLATYLLWDDAKPTTRAAVMPLEQGAALSLSGRF